MPARKRKTPGALVTFLINFLSLAGTLIFLVMLWALFKTFAEIAFIP